MQGRARVLERAAHRVLGHLEHGRDFLGPEPQNVAQDEDRPLARRQELECADERERDRLCCLIPCLWARRGFGELLKQYVGVRLEPDHLA